MSLFDSASVVITPSGYKEDKLYSIKPTDGSGDLVVTRATTATRVNSEGLIEQVPYNLLERSEQFDNAYWGKANMVIVANETIAPNGTATADKATSSLYPSTSIFKSQLVSATNHTLSCYVKADSLSSFRMEFVSSGYAAGTTCIYNLTTQATTITNYGSTTGSTATITSIGNGWFRCTLTVLSTATTYFTQLFPAGNGSLFLWGAQLVTGTSAKEYFPTTDRLDIPRLDYTNSTCPSILVEPQRTNLATYSEQFDDASWTKSSATITANTSVAPTGNTTADTLLITSGGYLLKQVIGYSAVSGQSITISIFAKNQITNFLTFGGATASGTDVYTIQDYGNGWYRHIRTRTFTTTATTTLQYIITQVGTNIIWGAQLEAGSYATSYIPTIASSVTRNADVISKTGISSLIGQTEGTIFLDVNLNSRAQFTYFALAGSLASSQNYLGIFFGSSAIGFESVVSASLQAGINFSNSSTGRFKIGIGYKANDFVLYINGNLIGTDTSGTVPACNDLSLTAYGTAATINYNTATLWKERLSNETLATLTTI